MNQVALTILRNGAIATLAAIAALSGGPASAAEQAPSIHRIAQFGGPSKDVTVEGSRAYWSLGSRVVVSSLDPERPLEVEAEIVTASLVTALATWPDRLAVAEVSGSVTLYNTNSLPPTAIARGSVKPAIWGSPTNRVVDMVANESALVVATGDGLDLHDPAALDVLATLPDVRAPVALEGVTLVGLRGNGLAVIDVSDPELPREVGYFAFASVFYHVADVGLSGAHAVLSLTEPNEEIGLANRLMVVDVKRPSGPALVGEADIGEFIGVGAVAVHGDSAIVLPITRGPPGPQPGLALHFDISNPAAPVLGEEFRWAGRAGAVAAGTLDGELTIAFTLQAGGLRALVAGRPVLFAHEVPAAWTAIAARPDGVVAIDAEFGSVWRFDMLEGRLVPGGRSATNTALCGAGCRVILQGTTAYVADQNKQLAIYDVGAPGGPRLLSERPGLFGKTTSVAVIGTTAVVGTNWDASSGGGGIYTLDVSDPAAPLMLGRVPTWNVVDVQAAGDMIVAVSDGALIMVDVSNPESPRIVGSRRGLRGRVSVDRVVCNGRRLACVTLEGSGVAMVDLTHPERPHVIGQLEGSLRSPYYERGVVLVGERCIVADQSGLREVDVSNPADPREVRYWAASDFGMDRIDDIAVEADRLYAADRFGGFFILALDPSASGPMAFLPALQR